jgi:hypothetical protein
MICISLSQSLTNTNMRVVTVTVKLNRSHLAKVLEARDLYLDAGFSHFTSQQPTTKRKQK